jgi:hypothetical protein
VILRDNLLGLSSSWDWEEAKHEWQLECVSLLDRRDPPGKCLCSHSPIRELCVLRNAETGHSAVVGNVCVKQCLRLDTDDVVASLRRVRDRPDAASLSAAAARYAHGRGWLTEWELGFCLDNARRRKLSAGRRAKRSEINRTVVIRMRLDATHFLNKEDAQ